MFSDGFDIFCQLTVSHLSSYFALSHYACFDLFSSVLSFQIDESNGMFRERLTNLRAFEPISCDMY
jgi:hypothetical protein